MSMDAGRPLWAATALIMATITAVVLGRPPASGSDALKATSQTIVDGRGKERAFLGLEAAETQSPRLVLRDADEMERLQMDLAPENGAPWIGLADEHGKIGISIAFNSPVMMTAGGSHPGDATISISRDGLGLLTLSTGTSENRSFGRIELRDSREGPIFVRPDGQ